MSLYADYVKERFDWETLELEGGFISWYQDGNSIWVREFYVRPDLRGTHLAKRMVDHVCDKGRADGATKVRGTVTPGTGSSDRALKMLLHYGSRVILADAGSIILEMEL